MRAPTAEELALLDNPPPEIKRKQDHLTPLALRWIKAVEGKYSPNGRPLSNSEMEMAAMLGVAHPGRVRVVVLDRFPAPENEMLRSEVERYGLGSTAEGARTMGYVIFIKPRFAKKQWLLAHELVHVAQQENMGRAQFVRRLIAEYELLGYRRSPLELKANERALEYR